jgi:mRNA-degrading endonuclease toxin of MazEF toxin-antitoxin module
MEFPKNILKDMKELVNKRLDKWHIRKKEITHKNNPVNKHDNQKVIFDIKPWTIWWYEAGENVGRELGSHVNDDDTFFFNRPCIVVSKVQSLVDSDHTLLTILPMSTKSEGIGIHKKYIHKIDADKYPKDGKLKGLNKTSYVVCHQIKTIDTKRLISMRTNRIDEDDIVTIRNKMKKYIDIA